MSRIATRIGPQDQGRRMSLEDHEFVETQAGYRYELSRGIITVSAIPTPSNVQQIVAVRDQLIAYQLANPGKISLIAGGGECKILVWDFESERHPDVAVYKRPSPSEDDKAWRTWIPELVVEVVSPGSEHRDYDEKSEEYLAVGVKEYWIVDAQRDEMLVLRRQRGKWAKRTIHPGGLYTTRLFPGLNFDLAAVFRSPGR
jgi:Uma2 family endonuclease